MMFGTVLKLQVTLRASYRMKDWKNSLVKTGSTIRDAVEALNVGGFEIALVVDDDQQLHGTITDGDIRRGLLSGLGTVSYTHLTLPTKA